jgi:hypothetical protein
MSGKFVVRVVAIALLTIIAAKVIGQKFGIAPLM